MKQIKFRGKDINGHYVYGLLTKKKNRNTNKLSYAIARGDFSQAETIPVAEDSVAQFIGYDADGNEVYEGDELVDSNDTNYFGALFYTATTRKISDNAPGILKDCVLKKSQDEEER